ncbi:hypothetical protein [Fundidesulfovibrio butyratiphilus]
MRRPDRARPASVPQAVRRLLFALVVALLLVGASTAAWAQTLATSARVLYYGDFSSPKSSAVVQAGPGTRFGLEVAPEGGPKDAPVVLEVRVTPPGSNRVVDPVVFLAAGRMGQGMRLAYQFVYDWEVLPGTWSMEVLCGETRLTGAVFVVSKTSTGVTGESGTAPLRMDAVLDRSPGKSSSKTSDKTSGRQPEKSPERSPTKPSEPQRERASQPHGGAEKNVAPKAPSGGSVSGSPERRVYVVMGGVFSEEGRALWMAALLKGLGAKPCVRQMESEGRRLWGVVLGWRDTLDQAKKLRDDMARLAKDVAVVPMSAGDLDEGLVCR